MSRSAFRAERAIRSESPNPSVVTTPTRAPRSSVITWRRQSIKGYDIFSDAWANGLAHIIAPLEIAGGVLLLLGIFLRKSSVVGTIVLILFIVGISQAWSRGIVTDCGCFGNEGISSEVGMNYAKTIARDCFYIFLMLWTYFRPFKRFALYA